MSERTLGSLSQMPGADPQTGTEGYTGALQGKPAASLVHGRSGKEHRRTRTENACLGRDSGRKSCQEHNRHGSPNVRIKSARLGHNTIVCPITHLYFSNPGYNRLKGVSSVARVYNFEPVADELTPEEKARIIGVQGCIWTEWTKDSVKMEWQMMPRIAALSELQWCNPERKDLNGFLKRLRHQMDLYELYGYHYKEDIEDVTISVKPKGQDGIAVVELNTFDNASVYYTLDGSEPTSESLRYTEPFMINRTTTIKARAIRNGRESNVTEETLTYNLATMHSITP